MHADIVPLAYVRGKCEVKHKEEIPDLENWKREKDCFYWHQVRRVLHRGGLGGELMVSLLLARDSSTTATFTATLMQSQWTRSRTLLVRPSPSCELPTC